MTFRQWKWNWNKTNSFLMEVVHCIFAYENLFHNFATLTDYVTSIHLIFLTALFQVLVSVTNYNAVL